MFPQQALVVTQRLEEHMVFLSHAVFVVLTVKTSFTQQNK